MIVDVTLGPPTVFLVEQLPGQTTVALGVESHGLRRARIELHTDDPLAGTGVRAKPVCSGRQPLMLGRDEQASPVPISL